MSVSEYLQFCFFQAEDGIRDLTVTGVQTCALPISVVFNQLRNLPSSKSLLKVLLRSGRSRQISLAFSKPGRPYKSAGAKIAARASSIQPAAVSQSRKALFPIKYPEAALISGRESQMAFISFRDVRISTLAS